MSDLQQIRAPMRMIVLGHLIALGINWAKDGFWEFRVFEGDPPREYRYVDRLAFGSVIRDDAAHLGISVHRFVFWKLMIVVLTMKVK